MKCVVGIDLEGRYLSALALLGKLKLDVSETTLVHATEPLQLSMPYSAYGMFTETDEIHESLQKAGKAALAEASAKGEEFGLNPRTEIMEGFPTPLLNDVANQRGAELISIASSARSAIGAIFGGSVARGLAIESTHSVLVTREALPKEGPLEVVMATDQSPYCAECLKLLVSMAPKGIAHLTLLTVYEREKHDSLLSLMKGGSKTETLDETQKNLELKGAELAQWMNANGIPTTSKVVAGHVEESIHAQMKESDAELLIVGSRGHGLLDRIVVGSTCLHEIVHEKYPVLLLRPHTA